MVDSKGLLGILRESIIRSDREIMDLQQYLGNKKKALYVHLQSLQSYYNSQSGTKYGESQIELVKAVLTEIYRGIKDAERHRPPVGSRTASSTGRAIIRKKVLENVKDELSSPLQAILDNYASQHYGGKNISAPNKIAKGMDELLADDVERMQRRHKKWSSSETYARSCNSSELETALTSEKQVCDKYGFILGETRILLNVFKTLGENVSGFDLTNGKSNNFVNAYYAIREKEEEDLAESDKAICDILAKLPKQKTDAIAYERRMHPGKATRNYAAVLLAGSLAGFYAGWSGLVDAMASAIITTATAVTGARLIVDAYVQERWQPDIEFILHKAHTALKNKDYARVESLVKPITKLNINVIGEPLLAKAHEILGKSYFYRQKFAKAHEEFNHTNSKTPEQFWLQGWLADARARFEKPNATLESVIRHNAKGDVFLKSDELIKAKAEYEAALAMHEDPQTLAKLARVQYHLAEFDGAIGSLLKALEIHPDFIGEDDFVFGDNALAKALRSGTLQRNAAFEGGHVQAWLEKQESWLKYAVNRRLGNIYDERTNLNIPNVSSYVKNMYNGKNDRLVDTLNYSRKINGGIKPWLSRLLKDARNYRPALFYSGIGVAAISPAIILTTATGLPPQELEGLAGQAYNWARAIGIVSPYIGALLIGRSAALKKQVSADKKAVRIALNLPVIFGQQQIEKAKASIEDLTAKLKEGNGAEIAGIKNLDEIFMALQISIKRLDEPDYNTLNYVAFLADAHAQLSTGKSDIKRYFSLAPDNNELLFNVSCEIGDIQTTLPIRLPLVLGELQGANSYANPQAPPQANEQAKKKDDVVIPPSSEAPSQQDTAMPLVEAFKEKPAGGQTKPPEQMPISVQIS